MKVPLVYPKIPSPTGCPLKKCHVFEKYDGTNMHWVFKKSEWVSFGTRRDSFPYSPVGFEEFAKAHPELSEAPKLFDAGGLLEEFMMRSCSPQEYTLFTEYHGKNSFAGQHQPGDSMRHTIIDLIKGNKMMSPNDFIKFFTHTEWVIANGYDKFDVAKCIHSGKYTGQLVEDIRNGKYPLKEGAVIKGLVDKQTYMTKVKTNAYMERLKSEFKDKWSDYWE